MKCRQAGEWMDRALDGGPDVRRLPGDWRTRLEAHLTACPGCRRQWDVLQAADLALRAPQPVTVPAELLAEFRQRLAADQRETQPVLAPPARRVPWLWSLIPAATAGVAVSLVVAMNIRPPLATGVVARAPAVSPSTPDQKHQVRSAIVPPTSATIPAAPTQKPSSRDQQSTVRETPAGAKVPALAPGMPPLAKLKVEVPAVPGVNAPQDRPAPTSAPITGKPTVLAEEHQVKQSQLYLATPASKDAFGREGLRDETAAQDLPPELKVSPAVLTALQRPVRVAVDNAELRDAARTLSELADVPVRVKGTAPVLRRQVDLDAAVREKTPLWVVLQSVAEQNDLQIVPADNAIVLQPAPVPEMAKKLPAGAAVSERIAKSAGPGGERFQDQEVRLRSRSDARQEQEPRRAIALPPAAAPPGPRGPAGSTAPAKPRQSRGFASSRVAKSPALQPAPAPSGGARPGDAQSDYHSVTADALPNRTANGAASGGFGGGGLGGGFGGVGVPAAPAPQLGSHLAEAGPKPDRQVWPEVWGTLPERRFAVPTPEEVVSAYTQNAQQNRLNIRAPLGRQQNRRTP